ncbi:hypothetical protein TrLO_g4601 [Triparma laevis f. longispina]|uniref:N-acetyltransferase domain-containing protein n=1 Tax=Triparma laevis f. longispina TaxID=1714387 RepID=A0A9W7FVE1_9STRA|nr:hypothetical protein TrLO_g4601 [Triparma laevis f. longispina]
MKLNTQAKLLFLYFLRSSSIIAQAFETSSSSSAGLNSGLKHSFNSLSTTLSSTLTTKESSTASSNHNSPALNLRLRLAKASDITSIQKCNLATLPENYQSAFYASHLKSWPSLALVAELTSHDDPNVEQPYEGDIDGYNPSSTSSSPNLSKKETSKVIAYVLGKIDDPTTTPATSNSLGDLFFTKREKMRSGHVTSLAVLKEYRRLGLASQLMDQLHHQMLLSSVSSIGLHVRVTNKAATRLYETTMGYHVSRVIPSYYQDGEDAYLMNKSLPVTLSNLGSGGEKNHNDNNNRITLKRVNQPQYSTASKITMRQLGTASASSEMNLPRMLEITPEQEEAEPVVV